MGLNMTKPAEKVLLVDDDRNLLESFTRQFHKRINLVTAASGEDAIQAVTYEGPFAVVISDMQMPNMDGLEFLIQVRMLAQDTVRVMLTGNANLDVAIRAINDGNIYRFLQKPVPIGVLFETMIDGIQQYRLVTAEKELLNKTLKGAVNLLADILGLINPASFSRASRIKRNVRYMATELQLQDVWNYELAAMLSQLGCITLPGEVMEKLAKGEEISNHEQQQFNKHPEIGARLLQHIPRFEAIAAMVENQVADVDKIEIDSNLSLEQKGILGGQILKVALAYDNLMLRDINSEDAITQLKEHPNLYDPALVQALVAGKGGASFEVMTLPVTKLKPGMILDQNIYSTAGTLLVAKGQELSTAVLLRLISSEENEIISGPVRVLLVMKS
jgi:response regulator RpfG family c-di-GMP phosphodiesterase